MKLQCLLGILDSMELFCLAFQKPDKKLGIIIYIQNPYIIPQKAMTVS